ncbi:GTP-binding protein TypA, partial [Trifolium pratense]
RESMLPVGILRDMLDRELERNLAMKVEDGETADTFIVSGCETLHITILIENMEGYEFMVGPLKVIQQEGDRQSDVAVRDCNCGGTGRAHGSGCLNFLARDEGKCLICKELGM